MSRTLTAADRSALIRLASTMPVGSTERRAILAGLSHKATETINRLAMSGHMPDNAPDWVKSSKSKRLESVDMDGDDAGRVYFTMTSSERKMLEDALKEAQSMPRGHHDTDALSLIRSVSEMVKRGKFHVDIHRYGKTWEHEIGGSSDPIPNGDKWDQWIPNYIQSYVDSLKDTDEG